MSTPNKERLRLWVEDLRTTNAKQGKRWLRSEEGWCCLGRACEVYRIATGRGRWHEFTLHLTDESGIVHSTDLPSSVCEWFGLGERDPKMRAADGTLLTAQAMNDGKKYTFAQIADAIERTYNL
jgi:hypothetical protein